ncbi:transposase [Streptomyces sp. NPDC001156]
MHRHELTDQEGELLAPSIPRAGTGRLRVDDRRILNGMAFKIRTGITWRDRPERFGPWKTVYTRFRRYALHGVFTRALQQLQAWADAAGDIDWLVQIDSTLVRAHQHAAATGRKGRSVGQAADALPIQGGPNALGQTRPRAGAGVAAHPGAWLRALARGRRTGRLAVHRLRWGPREPMRPGGVEPRPCVVSGPSWLSNSHSYLD